MPLPEQPGAIKIAVPAALREFAQPALARLGYLYPCVEFAFEDGQISASARDTVDADALKRDVLYAVYRERIYAQTLPFRKALIEAVTRR